MTIRYRNSNKAIEMTVNSTNVKPHVITLTICDKTVFENKSYHHTSRTKHAHDHERGYLNRFFTLQRCTTLPIVRGTPVAWNISSLFGIYRCHRSLPKVSSLESATQPLHYLALTLH